MWLCVYVVTLQALCTAVTEQNLLKTVTQIFGEAEAARLANANGNDKRVSPHYSYTQSAGMLVVHMLQYFTTAVFLKNTRGVKYFTVILWIQIPVSMMRSCSPSCTPVTSTSQAPRTKGHYPEEPETVGIGCIEEHFKTVH